MTEAEGIIGISNVTDCLRPSGNNQNIIRVVVVDRSIAVARSSHVCGCSGGCCCSCFFIRARATPAGTFLGIISEKKGRKRRKEALGIRKGAK